MPEPVSRVASARSRATYQRASHFYLDHRTVATPANVHDSIVYLLRLDRQVERFDFDVGAVGLDAGYATPGIARGLLEERTSHGVTGLPQPDPAKAAPDA